MPWFQVNDSQRSFYCFREDQNALMFEQLKLGVWQATYKPFRPKLFNYKTLLHFFRELQSALNNGLQLNEAIKALGDSTRNSALAKNSQALLDEIQAGKDFNETLAHLSTSPCQPYCQLISTDGSREDCEKSLASSITQLDMLLSWSVQLMKGLTYPFFIIQIALLINLLDLFYKQPNGASFLEIVIPSLAIYLLTSLVQIAVLVNLSNGQASNWLERLNTSFRLTKLLVLLNASRKTGKTLQQALEKMPLYFRHQKFNDDIHKTFYLLQLGQNYQTSFPRYWFPKESFVALQVASKSGDIDRALHLAERIHEKRSQRVIYWCEKVIPACCLFIAGGYAVSTLLAIYQPMLELK